MKIELSNMPVIDNHYHGFDKRLEPEKFEDSWCLSMMKHDKETLRNTLLFRLVMKEMKRFFGLAEDATDDEVIEARNKMYTESETYVDDLHKDAKLKSLVLDIGYPNTEICGFAIDEDVYATKMPFTSIRKMVRIEPVIFKVLNQSHDTYGEFVEKFRQVMMEDIEFHKAVALKTVIAYRTGLDIQKNTIEEIEDAYLKYQKNPEDHASNKIFRDALVYETLEICKKTKLPLQIHTGMGDSPWIDIRGCNPLDLYNILKDEDYREVKIVIVHSGYPNVTETGLLANHYPNVYVDLSEMIPFSGIGAERTLTAIFEMAPINKIMYGSDNSRIPEIGWFSAVYFKRYLAKVLEKLVTDEVVDEKYAYEMAEMILYKNAINIYGLENINE